MTYRGITVAALLAAAALTACGGGSQNVGNNAAQTPATGGHTVVYKLTGTAGKADVTYTTDGAGSVAQEGAQAVPWTKTLELKGNFLVFSLTGQNKGAKGTITCTVTVDGKVVKSTKSTGAYAVAMCSGTV